MNHFTKVIALLLFLHLCVGCHQQENFLISAVSPTKSLLPSKIKLPGMNVSNLLSEFRKQASQLIFQGENSGNALLTSLGNQINLSIQNASILLHDQLATSFDNLGVLEQGFFTELNSVVGDAVKTSNRAIGILEVSNLNVMELTNRLPLTSKNYNYINKVDGLCQIHSSGNYRLHISGLGFGQNVDNVKYSPKIYISGHPVPTSAINRQGGFDMEVILPNEMLEKDFKIDKINFLPLKIEMNAEVTNKCGLFFKCHDQVLSEWELKIVLLPINAGVITGEEILTTNVLNGVTETISDVVNTGNGDSRWSRSISVDNNKKIVAVRYVCSSGMCAWSYPARQTTNGADFDILNEGRTATVYRFTQGPATITHYIDYQTYSPVTNIRAITPIPFQFGKEIHLALNTDNTSCSYRLYGKLTTGQEFFIDNNMVSSADKIITRVSTGSGPSNTACAPTFIVSPVY